MQNSRSRGSSYRPHRRPAGAPPTVNAKSNESSTKVNHEANAANQAVNDDNACVVCFKNFDIYSIGDCDHPVCYECSTRMRVLCQQNECPICRHVLSKVLFTLEKLPYRELEANNRCDFYSKKYRIGFCSAEIQQKFYELLNHPCPICDAPPYRTFDALRDHVRREHHMYFCDLCVETLKIFTFERRCYTQAELVIHNAKGDPDNTSHRGHPLCEYCNERYVDRDELFRHLRRNHYFCHFCDADGGNDFYNVYADLADHFRKEHFLCEEGKCATEEFTGAFRNEIEYKAHVASVHGKTLNKQQVKQTRTLQLEITLGPRGRRGQNEQNMTNMRSRNEDNQQDYLDELPMSSAQRSNPVTIDAGNEEEFPMLAGITPGPNVSLVRAPPPSMRNISGSSGLARTKENFPALGAAAGGSISTISGAYANARAAQFQQPAAASFKKSAHAAAAAGATGGGVVARANAPANGMLLHVSNRPASRAGAASGSKKSTPDMDFPALRGCKGKKLARNLDEDMLPSDSTVPMTIMAAKHRSLMDDYVSVAHPSTHQKLQMVQKEESEAKARIEALKKSAPKLTALEFPMLGPSSTKTVTGAAAPLGAKPNGGNLNWSKPISEKKQKDLDNRKSKVAPAPLLPSPMGSTKALNSTSSNKNNGNNQDSSSKKDKKSKDKKPIQETQPKANKQKEKNNNNTKNNNNNNNINSSDDKQQLSNSNGNLSSILRAPPGLSSAAAPTVKPPPGFMSNVTVNSVAKLPNNLTFTSSMGENYSIVPTACSYTDPPDTTNRNQSLVDQLREMLKTPEAFTEFRLLSSRFREGTCSGQAYYDHCKSAMASNFHILFPELLVMLPDIGKQQELYLVHKQYVNSLSPALLVSVPRLEVCSCCKQVVAPSDVASHQESHMLTKKFPTLGSAGLNNGPNAAAKHAQQK
ncbi:E3 ubiquitin-protein ligase ZNF598 [Drosophila grimshawi]|uniref:RING-type E3 ubiquitin transferase n=1 Tax=Drosophila grimshawi TaxID=7222 RepID=B4J819_DROGR|nr:E3 ubiquitin-protein ligase ZNF598 [Drosophila grimshawi]EDW02249.1 GH20002 [Drosophila grimshawi]